MSRMSRDSARSRKARPVRDAVGRTLWAGAALLLAIGAAWGGYEVGLRDSAAHRARMANTLRGIFDAERLALESERLHTEDHLNALAVTLGDLQSRMLRLEALGERLTEMGKLDAGEFDFHDSPAMGGPDLADGVSAALPEIVADLEVLSRRIEDREIKLSVLEDLLLNVDIQEATRPSGLPVESGWISSYFGRRKDPFTGRSAMHRGLDFAGPEGSSIIAVGDGVVSFAGARSGYGNTLEIRHGNGYTTRYAHNDRLLVSQGDLVRQGQPIATMGDSGRATGVHLHFEVIQDGKTVNPLKFVKAGNDKADG